MSTSSMNGVDRGLERLDLFDGRCVEGSQVGNTKMITTSCSISSRLVLGLS